MGLFFDEDTQQIYIADCDNNRVQVMSLQGGVHYKIRTRCTTLVPWGISVNKDHIFVTDSRTFFSIQVLEEYT